MSNQTIVHIYHDEPSQENLTYVASKTFEEDATNFTMLDESFHDTNSHRSPWVANENIDPAEGVRKVGYCRSTMVGDIMNIVKADSTSTWHMVDNIGFKLIDSPDLVL